MSLPTTDTAVALNTAFMGDGAVIEVAAGVALARPLHLVFFYAGREPGAVFTRSLAVIGKGARAMLVESHGGLQRLPGEYRLEVKIGDAAHVNHIKITRAGALHVSSLMAAVGSQARFNEFLFTAGAALLVRNQMFVRLEGEGTIAGIRGACLLRERQHADTTLLADHVAPGCTSREMFKSVLDEESRGVFQGKIVVRPHAQKPMPGWQRTRSCFPRMPRPITSLSSKSLPMMCSAGMARHQAISMRTCSSISRRAAFHRSRHKGC